MRNILTTELRKMLQENRAKELRALAVEMHPADLAEAAAGLEGEEVALVLKTIGDSNALNIFEFLPLEIQMETIEFIPKDKLVHMIEEMSADNRADLVKNINEELRERFMPYVAQAERNDIRRLMTYEEDTAGSVMTTEYASLPSNLTVSEALNQLRSQAPDKETIYYVYITGVNRKLEGFLSLKDIILANPRQILGQIMHKDQIFSNVNDDVEAVAEKIAKYDLLAIPVVDDNYRLMGIVTVDDVIDIVEHENTEDFQKISAVVPLEFSYFETKFFNLFGHRFLWLLILLLAETISGSILARYENALKSVVALAFFIPLLMDTAGNAGSQASTMMVRALSVGEVHFQDYFRVMRRELLMGLLLGGTLSLVAIGKAYFLGQGGGIGITVGIALGITIVVANITGASLPILSKKFGLDPALISAPLITTMVDVVGLIVYFETAHIILLT